MSTNTGLKRPLLIIVAIVLAIGILWFGAMLLMHLMMMGAPDDMAVMMAVPLLALILLGVLLLVVWRRVIRNKETK